MSPRILCAAILLCAPATQLSAQERRWWPWPVDPDPQGIERGRPEFARACGKCHAENATGTKAGPNLIRSAIVRHDKDGSAIAKTLGTGSHPKAIPELS